MIDFPTIPATMRVPVFVGEGHIEFGEKPVPEPGAGQLLLRVAANALCGSERPQYLGGSAVTPGHEAAGVVAAAGPNTRTPVGTPGVVFLMDYCGECRSCRLGHTNQCLAKRADYGFTHDGGYAPFELVNENVFFPVDPDLPLTEATLLLDVMGTCSHAVERARHLREDIESLLVAGAGPVGLGMVAMARLLLGEGVRVLVTDVSPHRLDLAARLGALPVNVAEGSLAEGLGRHGLGAVDAAIDASGKGAARQEALANLSQRGVLVCVGHGEGLNLTVSSDLIAPERSVLGSEYFRYDELPGNLDLLRRHRAYLSQIITHRFPPEEIGSAFELFFSGRSGKVVIEQ
ncbi:zinc-binding dehydrogenase [Deinococcus planocerae]|uniref:zinc-binding dehydrogenase n=1 Tax=Deinococcus planocerae TaxID=1737569 RepID=UPI001CA49AE7|nr:zinc-binding dehydrogenase [Deinococcus planocerae]